MPLKKATNRTAKGEIIKCSRLYLIQTRWNAKVALLTLCKQLKVDYNIAHLCRFSKASCSKNSNHP